MITRPYDGSLSHVDIPNMFFVMASNLTSLLHIPQINRSCYSRTTLLQIPVQNVGCRAAECGTYCYGSDETWHDVCKFLAVKLGLALVCFNRIRIISFLQKPFTCTNLHIPSFTTFNHSSNDNVSCSCQDLATAYIAKLSLK